MEFICAGWSKELLESLCDAVSDLRKELRLLGSDLIVLTARTEHVLSRLAQKVCIHYSISIPVTIFIAEFHAAGLWRLLHIAEIDIESSSLSPVPDRSNEYYH